MLACFIVHARARIGRAVLLVLLPAALCNCGGQPASGPLIIQRQHVEQLTIALALPERSTVAAEQEAQITLADTHGPVEHAQVWLAVLMPTMPMGTNEPDAQAQSDGRYRSTIVFPMAGTWNVDVHAVIGGDEYVAHFYAQAQ